MRSQLVLSKNAQEVLRRRYLKKDESGNIVETPEEMFWRVAESIAKADLRYDPNADIEPLATEFYNMMCELRFLPNSPTFMNAGRPLGQLSACFVLPVEDSMEGIFETIKQAALIHKSGGGTGFSFSRLRPEGSVVNSTGGVASGPVSFMRVFNMATEAVKQGGTRRGANMGILRVDHPDILKFITCKQDNTDIVNFNISVGVTERFMQAVESGGDYDLINPADGAVCGSLNARDVFEKIVDNAWNNGEPGIIFLDRMNRGNVVPSQGEIESTNPCGEQPLLPYESCNLGSVNLSLMLKPGDEPDSYVVDSDKLRQTVFSAVHFLDNVIDVNNYPLDMISETTRKTRKIGLGVMGFADMLLKTGIPYDSEEAVAAAEKIMLFVEESAKQASQQLAERRGSFPLFSESTFAGGPPMRNATVTTIAPTGTLSILASCSSGVEPVFAFAFERNIMDNTRMVEGNDVLTARLMQDGLYTEQLMKKIAAEGSIAHIAEIPESIRRVFRSAHDISPEYHIKIQAAFQKYTDNAVSKTVNFKNEATKQDVADVYMLAYTLGCKGVTIYRDGSRQNQVLSVKHEEPEQSGADSDALPDNFGQITPRARPEITKGFTERVKTGCGNLYITVNYDKNGICEVFTSTGKGGGCPSQSEATARLVSVALRSGIALPEIYDQLKGIRCPSTVRVQGLSCTSCPDAIARVIAKVDKAAKQQNGHDPETDDITVTVPPKGLSANGKGPVMGGAIMKSSTGIERPADDVSSTAASAADSLGEVERLLGSNAPAMATLQTEVRPIETSAEQAPVRADGSAFPKIDSFSADVQSAAQTSAAAAAAAPVEEPQRPGCPECGNALEHEGGCVICRHCGYSKCG